MLTPGFSPLQGNGNYRSLMTGGFEPNDPPQTPTLTPYTNVPAGQPASLREQFPWSATKLQISSSKKTNASFLAHFPSLKPLRPNQQNNVTPLARISAKVAARVSEELDQTNYSDQDEVCRDLRDELILSPIGQLSLKNSPEEPPKEAKPIDYVDQLEESQTLMKEISAEMELSVNFDDIRTYLKYFNEWPPGALLSFPKKERMDFKVWMTVFASQLQTKEDELKKDSVSGIEQDKVKRIALQQLSSDKQLLQTIENTLKDPKLDGYFDD